MKNSFNPSLSMLGLVSLTPVVAFAHPAVVGTVGLGAGFTHPLGGTDHLLAMVAVGLWAAQMGGRAIWTLPSTFVSLMLFGGTLALAGVHIPYGEIGIVMSVLVLGMLIATALKFSLPTSALIVGIFALFHGYAHGTEMPLTIGAFSYGLGLAASTALLHAVGVVAATTLQRVDIARAVHFAGSAIAFAGVYLAVA